MSSNIDQLNSSASDIATPMGEIGGVYEICIGTRDSQSTLKYWEQFGFYLGRQGELSAEQAEALYGVFS